MQSTGNYFDMATFPLSSTGYLIVTEESRQECTSLLGQHFKCTIRIRLPEKYKHVFGTCEEAC